MSKLEEFNAAKSRSSLEANRLLFKWLSDDAERAALYRCLLEGKIVLELPSRADTRERPTDDSVFRQDVYLLSARSHVTEAIEDPATFSSAPYRALGSGTFMLGLDGGDHDAQRAFASAYLNEITPPVVAALAQVAWLAASVLPLKQREFDLAELAEQAALRYVGFLFGFAQADHVQLEDTMRKTYHGLTYQMLGRHFVSEPLAVPTATGAMAALLTRVAELLDLYGARVGRKQEDEYKILGAELKELQKFTIQDRQDPRDNEKPLADFVPVLKRIAEKNIEGVTENKFSGTELAVMVVGMIAGTIGNVQASVCIALKEFFDPGKANFERANEAAKEARKADGGGGGSDEKLRTLTWEALRLNPPAPFLPRKTTTEYRLSYGMDDTIPKDRVVILAIGGATRDGLEEPDRFRDDRERGDSLIFGVPGERGSMHQCIGIHLSMPLISRVVTEVLLLPGLTQSIDPRTGNPYGLEKLWGFMCRSYPLEYKRETRLKQSPLIVVMKVRTPVPEHAEALKRVIKYGAPRIERKLGEAQHVHFAQFLLIENDTKLVLFTVYDRDFDSYIEHFALEIGPLFDRIFEHIQDPPQTPVNEFPKDFVDTIRRHNARPVSGYFFSAYPLVDVSMIVQEFTRKNT